MFYRGSFLFLVAFFIKICYSRGKKRPCGNVLSHYKCVKSQNGHNFFNNSNKNAHGIGTKQKYPKYLHELYKNINDWGWFPLVGFIHDLGKILIKEEFGGLEQWLSMMHNHRIHLGEMQDGI